MASDLMTRAVEAARDAQDARWTAVRTAKPEPHARYLVRRGLVGPFVATPCYGLHEPWWVPLIGESKVVFEMCGDDEWRPLPDNEDAELAAAVRAVADVLLGEPPAWATVLDDECDRDDAMRRRIVVAIFAAQRRALDE